MFGLNCWQLLFCATDTCVLWLPLCYQSQCDAAEHRSGPSAFVGVNLQEPKLRDSCGVHECFLQVRDCPTLQGASGLPPLHLL